MPGCAQQPQILFTNARIIDGLGARCTSGWLLVEGRKISAIGMNSEPRPQSSRHDARALEISLAGCTLLPGLIDAHVHLTADASPDFAAQMSNDAAAVATGKMARNALSTLRAGFTAVRDLGGKARVNLRVRDALKAGLIRGTSVISAGHVICARGGHGQFMGKECEGTEAVRLAVSEELAAGADLVKFISTGGILTRRTDPGSCELSKAEITAGIKRAHAAGAKTATHALSTKGIADAVVAGVDSIEHGYLLSPDTVEVMLKRGTFLVPTISALARIIAAGEEAGIPARVVEKAKSVRDAARNSLTMARIAGVKVAMGTDAGTPFNHHARNAEELREMVEAGFRPMDALVASTGRAAELLGIAETTGSLTPGKQADLLVVRGDPLSDITVISDVDCIRDVYQAGIRIDSRDGLPEDPVSVPAGPVE